MGLKDNDGNIKYGVNENGNYKLYNENTSSNIMLYISNKKLEGYKETKVTINNEEYVAYEINSRFKLVYAMNLENGEYNYYKYDIVENTFQYYETENSATNNSKIFIVTTIVFAITTLGFGGYLLYYKRKK